MFTDGFFLAFFSVAILGAISLTVQEMILYRRLHDLVDNIDEFYQLVVSSRKEDV